MATDALKRAVEIAGGQKPLADRINTTQSNVWYWLERSKNGVPAEFVIAIERETGVPRHELRPDLYPVHESTDIARPPTREAAAE
jgi:DNA-binding transcriptional regulator YdaS (Cro superfamily)